MDTGYPPMHRYNLFQPQLSKLPVPAAFPEYFDFDAMSFPVAETAAEKEAVWMGEAIFRAGKKGIDDLVNGLLKLQQNRDKLPQIAVEFADKIDAYNLPIQFLKKKV